MRRLARVGQFKLSKWAESQYRNHRVGRGCGLRELIERHLADGRGKNTQLPFADLLRQSVYSQLAGYGGLQRRRMAVPGPDFPVARLEDLGA